MPKVSKSLEYVPLPTAPRLDILRCQCSSPNCRTYGFRQGIFYQGCGFDKPTAERIEKSYNACVKIDDPTEIVGALISLAKEVELLYHHAKLSNRATEILSHIRR